VRDGQALGCYHHAEQPLLCDDAILGQTEATQLSGLLGQAFGANRRQVIERHRQSLVDQRAQQKRDRHGHRIGVRLQSVHRAQQPLVGHFGGVKAQLGGRVAQPFEHQRAHQWLGIEAQRGRAKQGGGLVDAKFVQQPIKRQDIAVSHRRIKASVGRTRHSRRARQTGRTRRVRRSRHIRVGGSGWLAGGAQQAAEQVLDGVVRFVEPTDGGNGVLTRVGGLVATGLDRLQVAARSRASELDEHRREDAVNGQYVPTPVVRQPATARI